MEKWIIENILPIALFVCTVIYTWINYKMLVESKKVRQQKITPSIAAYIKISEATPKIIYLVIENTGEGNAYNTEFKIIKDSEVDAKLNLSNRNAIKNGVSFFPRNYKFEYSLGFVNNNLLNDYIDIQINYSDINNNTYTSKYNLFLGNIQGQFYCEPPDNYLGQVAYYLKEIDKKISKS